MVVFLQRTVLNTWLAWPKEETSLGRRKPSPIYFALQSLPVVSQYSLSAHDVCKPHNSPFQWLWALFIFCLSLFDRDFLLFTGDCSFCSSFNFALFPVVLVLGCYCATTRRSFSVSKALKQPTSPLLSPHYTPFLYNQNICSFWITPLFFVFK